MGQAYASRQSTLHDGNIITAALFNNEYNAILNAFSYASSGATGHQHDGTEGEGGNIHTIGDQDFLNKVVIESNEIKFFIEVGGAAVEQLNLADGILAPETDNDVDLGTSSKRFKTIYATTLDVSTALTNSQLANSTVSYGGISLALGATDATPAFDLSDATNYPTSSLSGTIATAQIADDAVTGAKIAHSTITSTNMNTSSVAAAAIQSSAVTTTKIADDAVTAAKIADDAVGSEHIEELSAELECGDQEVRNVKKLGIGFSGAPTYQLQLEDDKGGTNTELVRIKNTGSHFGRIASFYKGSSHHGYVGLSSVIYGQGVYMSSQEGGLKFQNQFTTVVVEPCDENGADKDNSVDLGRSANRFDDVYATNGTIQTSDQNEKQNIAELSDAERRVAVAAKGLLRKFKWQSAVTEKGDDARTHFGIIAQDLQAAFTAEELNASDYAMFINTTWWEHEGNKYYEAEHAPEGATTVTRLGVRYSELLAFIIAAL